MIKIKKREKQYYHNVYSTVAGHYVIVVTDHRVDNDDEKTEIECIVNNIMQSKIETGQRPEGGQLCL